MNKELEMWEIEATRVFELEGLIRELVSFVDIYMNARIELDGVRASGCDTHAAVLKMVIAEALLIEMLKKVEGI